MAADWLFLRNSLAGSINGRAKERRQRWRSVAPKGGSQGESPLNSPRGPKVGHA